jgi:hypothetical protein
VPRSNEQLDCLRISSSGVQDYRELEVTAHVYGHGHAYLPRSNLSKVRELAEVVREGALGQAWAQLPGVFAAAGLRCVGPSPIIVCFSLRRHLTPPQPVRCAEYVHHHASAASTQASVCAVYGTARVRPRPRGRAQAGPHRVLGGAVAGGWRKRFTLCR